MKNSTIIILVVAGVGGVLLYKRSQAQGAASSGPAGKLGDAIDRVSGALRDTFKPNVRQQDDDTPSAPLSTAGGLDAPIYPTQVARKSLRTANPNWQDYAARARSKDFS